MTEPNTDQDNISTLKVVTKEKKKSEPWLRSTPGHVAGSPTIKSLATHVYTLEEIVPFTEAGKKKYYKM